MPNGLTPSGLVTLLAFAKSGARLPATVLDYVTSMGRLHHGLVH